MCTNLHLQVSCNVDVEHPRVLINDCDCVSCLDATLSSLGSSVVRLEYTGLLYDYLVVDKIRGC